MTKKQIYYIGRSWCIQHPIVDGVACGVVFFITSSLLVGFAFPAWALTIPITDRIVIDLGDLPPWIASIIAFAVYWEARRAKQHAAEAVATSKDMAIKIDGMLVQRDKDKIAEGKLEASVAGEEIARTLAEGQRQGAETERASVSAANKVATSALDVKSGAEIPVTDDRVAKAAERMADANERVAGANERTASVAEEKKKN